MPGSNFYSLKLCTYYFTPKINLIYPISPFCDRRTASDGNLCLVLFRIVSELDRHFWSVLRGARECNGSANWFCFAAWRILSICTIMSDSLRCAALLFAKRIFFLLTPWKYSPWQDYIQGTVPSDLGSSRDVPFKHSVCFAVFGSGLGLPVFKNKQRHSVCVFVCVWLCRASLSARCYYSLYFLECIYIYLCQPWVSWERGFFLCPFLSIFMYTNVWNKSSGVRLCYYYYVLFFIAKPWNAGSWVNTVIVKGFRLPPKQCSAWDEFRERMDDLP